MGAIPAAGAAATRPVLTTHGSWLAIREAARSGYPEEACGILLGRDTAGGRVIEGVARVRNEQPVDRERRYLIPAAVLRLAGRAAARAGLEVVGFYHSHPDRPAAPSVADRELAWPWYTHLIVSVNGGEPAGVRAWRLREDRSGFLEQRLVILEPDSMEASP